ncbi:MAG TPA: PIN domain-containing protein [Nostocaceae cyanobacterium]|nr:PIN domain-containing protein [Nostocaceae cyanobacterium]
MIRTYLDSGVLIAAARLDNSDGICQKALNILASANRYFISSYYVKLEVLPHAIRNKNNLEAQFYETFFNSVNEWVECDQKLLEFAYQQMIENNGLSGIDAIHVAAAITAKADELITTEKINKPMCQLKTIKVISIHSIIN